MASSFGSVNQCVINIKDDGLVNVIVDINGHTGSQAPLG
jgi:hypothetical protein